ncbi:MAG: hypothetical protein JWP96_263 [Polaromonas sp.]|nr:hypothetical protein [Polaromonas sp.]
MRFKSAFLFVCGLLLSLSSTVWAQLAVEDPEWKESEVPPPPAFNMSKLVTFVVSPNSSLVFGVDPASVTISKGDGLVRYVVVAASASGARNVMYEGIRCATGEFKTYGRYSPEGQWDMVKTPEWRTMFGNMPSKHALRFAKAGACDNTTPAASVDELVIQLKKSIY